MSPVSPVDSNSAHSVIAPPLPAGTPSAVDSGRVKYAPKAAGTPGGARIKGPGFNVEQESWIIEYVRTEYGCTDKWVERKGTVTIDWKSVVVAYHDKFPGAVVNAHGLAIRYGQMRSAEKRQADQDISSSSKKLKVAATSKPADGGVLDAEPVVKKRRFFPQKTEETAPKVKSPKTKPAEKKKIVSTSKKPTPYTNEQVGWLWVHCSPASGKKHRSWHEITKCYNERFNESRAKDCLQHKYHETVRERRAAVDDDNGFVSPGGFDHLQRVYVRSYVQGLFKANPEATQEELLHSWHKLQADFEEKFGVCFDLLELSDPQNFFPPTPDDTEDDANTEGDDDDDEEEEEYEEEEFEDTPLVGNLDASTPSGLYFTDDEESESESEPLKTEKNAEDEATVDDEMEADDEEMADVEKTVDDEKAVNDEEMADSDKTADDEETIDDDKTIDDEKAADEKIIGDDESMSTDSIISTD